MSFTFSLIIPVYNVELYIKKCMLSCLKQENFSPHDYEIILVNDGTLDKSIEIAKEMVTRYPKHHVKFVERPNGGLSAARNSGLKEASGAYVWFIDSDDWIANDSLYCLNQKLKNNKGLEILTFTHQTVYANGDLSIETKEKDYLSSGFDFLSNNSFLSAWRCIYSLDFLKRNKFFFKEGILWEDSEFNLRAYGLAKKHYFYSKALYFYLRRENSITTKATSFKMIYSWFIKVDSIYLYYKDIQLDKVNENIVSNHQAKSIMAAVAGFNELSITEANIFRKKIKSNKQYYYNFFKKSGDIKLMVIGLLIIFALPIAEYLMTYFTKRAIKKGEGNV
jgi:glycosyltransferase involved in cell wall biosynthesis